MIPMRWLFMFATLSFSSLGLLGCADTYCQSGAKYGTQCYSMTDVRTPPGQRPPLSSEPPLWYKGPPPPTRYGSPPSPPPPVRTGPPLPPPRSTPPSPSASPSNVDPITGAVTN